MPALKSEYIGSDLYKAMSVLTRMDRRGVEKKRISPIIDDGRLIDYGTSSEIGLIPFPSR